MVKTIIFDLDDTLLWDKKSVATAFEKTCKEVEGQIDVEATRLESAVREMARKLYATYDTYAFTQMIGINPFEGLWGTFDDAGEGFKQMNAMISEYQRSAWTEGLAKLGIRDAELGEKLSKRFIEHRKQSPFVYDETFSVLDRLKGKYQLVLLTNGAPSLQYTKLDAVPELSTYFDEIIISGDFGIGKPDATIFQHVLSLTDTKANEALMVGDNLLTDILGAASINIKTVWINREGNGPHPDIIPVYEIDHLEKLFDIIEKIRGHH